jgi:hypothetical protein
MIIDKDLFLINLWELIVIMKGIHTKYENDGVIFKLEYKRGNFGQIRDWVRRPSQIRNMLPAVPMLASAGATPRAAFEGRSLG